MTELDTPTPARIILVLAGIGTLTYGAYLVLTTVGIERLPGLILWLAAAVLLHDLVLVPLVTAIGRLTTVGRSLATRESVLTNSRSRAAAYSRTLIVAAVLVSAVAVPEIIAKNRGVPNPTVLPLDYGQNLLWLWIAVASTVIIVLAAGLFASRRRE